MPCLKIRLAEKNILASVFFDETAELCKDYLSDFKIPDITIGVYEGDISRERERSKADSLRKGTAYFEPSDGYLESLALYRKIAEALPEFNTVLFHGSAIAVDGEGYLFTAKSGTGKSTHAALWRKMLGDRAVMINDDKPLIEITDSGATVYGTPWNGKHALGTNIAVPLKAICILGRGEENSISECVGISEFPKILSQTYTNSNPELVKKTMELVDKLLHRVKVYKLFCNVSPEAAEISFAKMKGNENEA